MARVVQGRRVGGARPPAARGGGPPPRRPPARSAPAPRAPVLRRHPIASLDARGRTIRDPVEKLRFLRRSLERYEALDERLQAVPGAPLRWLAFRLTGVEEARPLFSANPWGALDPPRRARPPLPRRARRAANAAALLLVAAAGLALASYPRSRPAPTVPIAAAPSTPAAEALDPLPRGVAPARIWMVDSGPGFELYSNGLRIDTTYAVAGEPRRYRVFEIGQGMGSEVLDRPVGIVFHTSESDIWPLEESFNEKLRDSSQNLLRYLKKNRVYHYLIDRFGQVFRVVDGDRQGEPRRHVGLEHREPGLPEPERAHDRCLLRDALGGRPRAADHARAARGGAQPHRLPPGQVVDRGRDVRDPRPRQRELEEAPHRPPPGLGAGVPVRGLRPARPVPARPRRRSSSSGSGTTSSSSR